MAMADNGFGTQDNSSDFLLRIYKIKPDFKTKTKGTGQVNVQSFIQLRDPNKLIPFNIINGNTPERLLTGADFDPESMQRTSDGTYWIGDEFGPYLLHFSADGVLLDAPIPLPNPLNPTQNYVHHKINLIKHKLILWNLLSNKVAVLKEWRFRQMGSISIRL